MTHICKPSTQELRQEIKNSRVARLQREIQLPIEKGGWVGWGWENRAPAQLLVFCSLSGTSSSHSALGNVAPWFSPGFHFFFG